MMKEITVPSQSFVGDARELEPVLQDIDWEDLLALDIKPREYILEPIISTQGLVMLHAFRGVGKTLVAMGAAVAVSSGGDFLKWSAPKARKVLYIDGELPAVTLKERLSHAIHALSLKPISKKHFRFVTPDLQKIGGIPNLAERSGQRAIEDKIEDAELLILDNLSTLCRSGEENAAESWLPIQEWILKLRQRGLAVLMLHHSGKRGAQRGTSKREDVLDTVLVLRHPKDYSSEQGARFEVHFEKTRGVYGDAVKPFVASIIGEPSDQAWKIEDFDETLIEQAIELAAAGYKQRDIANDLKISLGKVNKVLKQAKMERKI